MGRIADEITLKVKAAVKAKLMELGVEIDNELPDYIMVLIANKKSQDQMERDLQLFLGSNNIAFCSWLMGVLKKLEEVTVSSKPGKTKKSEQSEDDNLQDSQENDCLETTISAQEGLLGNEEEVVSEVKRTNDEENDKIPDKDSVKRGKEVEKDVESTNKDIKTVKEIPKDDHKVVSSSVKESEKRKSEYSRRERSVTPDGEGRWKRDEGRRYSGSKGSSSRRRSARSRSRSRSPRYYRRYRSRSRGGRSPPPSSRRRGYRSSPSLSPPHSSSLRSRRRSRSRGTERTVRKIVEPSSPKQVDARDILKRKVADKDGDTPPRLDKKKQRTMLSSSVVKSSESGSERSGRLSSLVKLTSPHRSHHGSGSNMQILQPNNKLLLKAVADAEKSVTSVSNSSSVDRRTKIRALAKMAETPQTKDSDANIYMPPEKLYVTLQNSSNQRGSNEDSPTMRAVRRNDSYFEEDFVTDDCLDFEVDEDEEYVPEPLVKSASRPSYTPSNSSGSAYRGYALYDFDHTSRYLSLISPARSPQWSENNNDDIMMLGGGGMNRSAEWQQHHSDMSGGEQASIHTINSPLTTSSTPIANSSGRQHSTYFKTPYAIKSHRGGLRRSAGSNGPGMLYQSRFKLCHNLSDNNANSFGGNAVPFRHLATLKRVSTTQQNETEKASPPNTGSGDPITMQSRNGLSNSNGSSRLWDRLGPPPTATVKPLQTSANSTESPTTKNENNSNLILTKKENKENDGDNLKLEAMNKALERCKYWPDCTEQACAFYHPSSPCKMFPHCKYGIQCLFIHPDCKYGSNCQIANCNYSHKNSVKGGYAVLCSYFPNCTNPFCKFRHPAKPCKYGSLCARTDCFYSHPPKPVIPPRELLSWKAAASNKV